MRWVKDAKLESRLHSLKIDYEVDKFKISDIDLAESSNRQVRLGKKLNEEWMLEYAEAMSQPDAAFPMVLLNRIKKHIWIWSGIHRVHSADFVGIKEIDAYVISVTDGRTQDVIPRIVNSLEGHRQSREESLIHAQYLIDTYKTEVKEVARLLSLRPATITTHMRSQQVASQILQEGANPAKFSKTLLTRLYKLSDNSNVLREASKFLCKHYDDLPYTESLEFVEEVKKCKTEHDQFEEIQKWEDMLDDRDEETPSPFRAPLRRKFLSILQSFNKFLTDINKVSELQLESNDIPKVVQYWSGVESRMHRFLREETKV